MRFCTRCGSELFNAAGCRDCGAPAYRVTHHFPVPEYAPAGNLPVFEFVYNVPLLSLIERQRQVRVPFSYINATLLEVSTHKDTAHSVHTQGWSQPDDPKLGPGDPIAGRDSQLSIRSILRLRMGSGAERSFVLAQVPLRVRHRSRVTLIFPVSIERALTPVYDYAAVAAVNYAANDYTWSTTHPENSCPAQPAYRRGKRAVRGFSGELPGRSLPTLPAAFCCISWRGSARPCSR